MKWAAIKIAFKNPQLVLQLPTAFRLLREVWSWQNNTNSVWHRETKDILKIYYKDIK